MPVRQYKSKNPSREPTIFFKGNRKDLENRQLNDFLKVFRVPNSDQVKANQDFTNFKAKISQELEYLKQQSATRDKSLSSKLFRASTPRGTFWFKMFLSKNGRIAIRQEPVYHGVHGGNLGSGIGAYQKLMQILHEGFQGGQPPNVLTRDHLHSMTAEASPNIFEGEILAEHYLIEFLAPVSHKNQRDIDYNGEDFVSHAKPEEIRRVNIILDSRSTQEEIAAKKKFYKEQIKNHQIRMYLPINERKWPPQYLLV